MTTFWVQKVLDFNWLRVANPRFPFMLKHGGIEDFIQYLRHKRQCAGDAHEVRWRKI